MSKYFLISTFLFFGALSLILWAYMDNVNYLFPFGIISMGIGTTILLLEVWYSFDELNEAKRYE